MQDNTIYNHKDDNEVEVVGINSSSKSKSPLEPEQKKKPPIGFRIISKFRDAKTRLLSTYSKRNPLANALLSLYLLAVYLLTGFLFFISIKELISNEGSRSVIMGFEGIVYTSACFYFNYKFVILNRRNAVFPAIFCSTFFWFIVLGLLYILYTPEDPEEEVAGDLMSSLLKVVLPVLLYVIFFCIVFGIIRLVMSLKKYGASAWTLLDVSRQKRPIIEKVMIFLILTLWVVDVAYELILQNSLLKAEDKFPTHKEAKIGDYYYTDGTISSDWLVDKTVAGIVFSLETSEEDKAKGFVNGQIVGYYDLSDKKLQWDDESHDIAEYPNYNWSNRMDALKDINGLGYMHCDGYGALPITLSCLHYLEDEHTEGISYWYVPTAGQWNKILENLGGVKVDKMLKFDAETATNYLDRLCLDPQCWYWTITEFDADNAWSIRLKNGEFGSRSNKQNGARVRPVASF